MNLVFATRPTRLFTKPEIEARERAERQARAEEELREYLNPYLDRQTEKPQTLGDILREANERAEAALGLGEEPNAFIQDRDPGDETDAPQAPYQIGDVVVLRSGGPGMTVEHVAFCEHCGNCAIDVVWFNGCELNELPGLDARTVDPVFS